MTTPPFEPHVPRKLTGDLVGPPARTEYVFETSVDDGEPAVPSQAINIHLILNVLRRWWPICTALGLLLAAVAGGVAWYTFKPMYRAVGWLQIESQPPYVISPRDERRTLEADQRYVRTQLALLRSPIVLDRVLERPEIASIDEIREMPAPVTTLAELLEAESEDDSDLYQISYLSESPQAAKLVINSVLEEFLRVVRDASNQRNRELLELLRAEAADAELTMTQLRSKVIELGGTLTERDDTSVAQSEEAARAEAWIQQLAAIEPERIVLEAQVRVLEQQLNSIASDVDEAQVDLLLATDPKLQEAEALLKQEVLAYEQMVSSLRHDDSGDGSNTGGRRGRLPSVLSNRLRDFRQKIEDQRQQIDASKRLVRQQVVDRERREIERRVDDLRIQLDSKQSLEAMLTSNLSRYRQSLSSAGDRKVELEFALSDLQRSDRVYEGLMNRIGELETETRAPARVTVLRTAEAPKKPIELSPLKRILVSALTALLLPFGLVLLREAITQPIGSVEQLPVRHDVPLFAEIPSLPQRIRGGGRRAAIAYDRSRAAFENSVHYLCRSLLLGRIDDNFRVLAVTSSVPGEGKTNLAVSIAASMARCLHEPVLLVDTDLRKPSAHQLLGVELNLGLADVLSGKCSLDEAIAPTSIDDVWLLSAGQVDLHPHSLLRPVDFERVLGEIRRRYSLTVLDTPPALAVGEALTVCKQADGVLLCAMRDITRRSQIVRACERLRLARIIPMGIVFSGVDSQSYEVRNGTYYYDQSSTNSA